MSELALIDEDERWMELERRELFRTSDPVEIKAAAQRVANELAPMINDRQLYKTISGRKHILVEGWTLLASLLGVSVVITRSGQIEDGWEARAEVFGRDGKLIGAAEAMCTRSESAWAKRDDHALRSMAQTRAISKALRVVLGFVFAIAGYETTPAEEMPAVVEVPPQPKPAAKAPDAVTEGQTQEIFRLLEELDSLDGTTDWAAWCREYAGIPFHKLDKIGADRVIVGLMEKVHDLSPPSEAE